MNRDITDKLAALGADHLAEVIARALATAGAIESWDSDTLENVFEVMVGDLPVPSLNDTEFWVEQAHRLGLDVDDTPPPWRWTPGCI